MNEQFKKWILWFLYLENKELEKDVNNLYTDEPEQMKIDVVEYMRVAPFPYFIRKLHLYLYVYLYQVYRYILYIN